MLELILSNEKTQYLLIRDQLDQIGIFNTGFQNQMLDKLEKIDSNLSSISNQLQKISSKLDLQNSLIAVNTLQLRNINKKLDS